MIVRHKRMKNRSSIFFLKMLHFIFFLQMAIVWFHCIIFNKFFSPFLTNGDIFCVFDRIEFDGVKTSVFIIFYGGSFHLIYYTPSICVCIHANTYFIMKMNRIDFKGVLNISALSTDVLHTVCLCIWIWIAFVTLNRDTFSYIKHVLQMRSFRLKYKSNNLMYTKGAVDDCGCVWYVQLL